MKQVLIFFILLLFTFPISGQNYFPDQCTGVWEGLMTIYANGEAKDSVPVKMTIEKVPDTLIWKWKTEYLSEKYPITKDYKLVLEDPTSNRYLLDENNGIFLYAYVYGNKMYSNFEVEGTYINSVYILNGDELIFEITSGKESGMTTNDIRKFSILNLQQSILKRKN